MFVIRHKNFFFALSGILVVVSLVAVFVWGLNFGVDFKGGSSVDVSYATSTPPARTIIEAALTTAGFEGVLVRQAGENGISIRLPALAEGDRTRLEGALISAGGTFQIDRLSSVGPSVGQELRRKTIIAISLTVLMIILYVAFVFRKVSQSLGGGKKVGVSSWIYGLVAILTLLHDIIIPTGVFAIFGHFSGLEADTLFVVALLTILGLSVNDTIVVFDRIRENLRRNQERHVDEGFDQTVGKSLEQTYVRSFNTSFTVILVLLVLFFLGGPTIHSFILTLLVGQVAGTYSSIFIASPMLVSIAGRKEKNKR
ncbi:MAG: protein translocase subunit SecF [Patescibacteria group bacterium]